MVAERPRHESGGSAGKAETLRFDDQGIVNEDGEEGGKLRRRRRR